MGERLSEAPLLGAAIVLLTVLGWIFLLVEMMSK